MQLILAATDQRLARAWTDICGALDNVAVHHGSILDIPCDAVVSPANSYGFMDGGIDAAYVDHFGALIQDRVRWAILTRHHGELLVGQAEVIETDNGTIPYLIAAPTMRIPMALNPETVNPYLAMRAVLLLIRHGRFAEGKLAGQPVAAHIRKIALPGLGTGVGRVPAEISARQVRQAILDHGAGKATLPTSWSEASETHQLLYTDKPVRLQH